MLLLCYFTKHLYIISFCGQNHLSFAKGMQITEIIMKVPLLLYFYVKLWVHTFNALNVYIYIKKQWNIRKLYIPIDSIGIYSFLMFRQLFHLVY